VKVPSFESIKFQVYFVGIVYWKKLRPQVCFFSAEKRSIGYSHFYYHPKLVMIAFPYGIPGIILSVGICRYAVWLSISSVDKKLEILLTIIKAIDEKPKRLWYTKTVPLWNLFSNLSGSSSYNRRQHRWHHYHRLLLRLFFYFRELAAHYHIIKLVASGVDCHRAHPAFRRWWYCW
jgi:hypothetical protein